MDTWSSEMKIIASLSFLLVIWMVRLMLIRLLHRSTEELSTRTLWRQIINFVTTSSAAFLLIRIWFEWFQSILTLLSVIAAALVIVNKEIVLNVTCYSVIVWRGLFKIGDRIQIGTTVGDVARLGIMYLSIVEMRGEKGDRSSGHVIKIPNKEVLDKHIVNLSRGQGLLWQEVTVCMPLAANWQKAVERLQEILDELSHQLSPKEKGFINDKQEEMIMGLSRKPEVFFKVEGEKYFFTCRYLTRCDDQRANLDRFWRAVLSRLDQEEDLYLVTPDSKE